MSKTARFARGTFRWASVLTDARPAASFSTAPPKFPTPDSRWLTDLRTRLKICLSRDLTPEQGKKAKELSDYVQANWLELLVGRDGFLTGKQWRGLDKHSVAWGDMANRIVANLGQHGHVNNVKYNRYAESGRVNWMRSYVEAAPPEHRKQWVQLMTPHGVGLILRSIRTDYKFPMTYPDETTVIHKLTVKPEYGADHVLLEAVILSERYKRPAARCFEDIVVFDYKAAKKTPLEGFMVDQLRKTFDDQESSRMAYEEKAQNLLLSVAAIEGSTK
ncbi:hypothetical protein G7046_g1247 [Stylonectria norvegica]|nr:hypothetical protein G7046_g1247 [Stylonectria norvegica]